MRRLNQKEQEFCHIILDLNILSENVIEKVCLLELEGLTLEVSVQEMRMDIRIPAEGTIGLTIEQGEAGMRTVDVANHQKLVTTIVGCTKLIRLLESQGLIYIFQNRPVQNLYTIGPEIGGSLTVVRMYAAPKVLEDLITYLQSGIIVTADFEEFVQNSFQSRDERHKLNEARKTQNAIFISAMAVVVSMIGILADCTGNASKDELDKLKIAVDSVKAQNSKAILPTYNLRLTTP